MKTANDNVQLIVIAGGTASGKTTVANKIAEILKGKKVIYLKMDHYYKKMDDLSLNERKEVNFDHPDALDLELLVEHINKLKKIKQFNIQLMILQFIIEHQLQLKLMEVMWF